MSKKKQRTWIVFSEQPCPVCGGHEWNPMVFVDDDDNSVQVVDSYHAMIDEPEGGEYCLDECVHCGTVVQ